jgi:hypothetical protein
LKDDKFLIRDKENNYRFAISTYDFGTAMFRWAIVYRIKNDALEVVEEVKGFNVAADENLYR